MRIKTKQEVAGDLFVYLDHFVPDNKMLGVEILTNTIFAYVEYHTEKLNLSETEAYRGVIGNLLNYVHDHEIPIPGLTVKRDFR